MANVMVDIEIDDIIDDLTPEELLERVNYSDIIQYMRDKGGVAEIAQRLAGQSGMSERAREVLKAVLVSDLNVVQQMAVDRTLVIVGDAEGIG